jgi:NAD(P)-dependent dehydrogenase (short-subunit alcohol dehydrogenase family)
LAAKNYQITIDFAICNPLMSRVAIVTGANRGIGLEVCRQLKAVGLEVILTSRDASKGQAAAKKLGVVYHSLEVTDPQSIAALKHWTLETYGRIEVLVNNAAINYDDNASVMNNPVELYRTTLEANTFGPLQLCQAFIPEMIKGRYGRVVNVSSSMGQLEGMSNAAPAYSMSKTALNVLTRMFASAGQNVLVNSVDPGWVRTDMGGPQASRSVKQGAAGIVWAATLPDGGPSGGFFLDGQPITW